MNQSRNQVVLQNIDPIVLDKLKTLAQIHNRSLEDEIKVILEQTASANLIEQITWSQAWARVETAYSRHQGQTMSDSAELLREDRQR